MPHRFPQEAVLRDGRRVILRPMNERDGDGLFEFFQRMPVSHRRFAWDAVENRSVIEEWSRNIDYARVFPLLATSGSKIIADATLHRRRGGPLRMVGRIRWMIEPEFRGVGLGTIMVNHLIDIARDHGLRHLSCMLISDLEADAVQTLTTLGFKSYVEPGYGTDPDGNQHDMTKLVLRL
ncbi:MAG TPA: GNAT family N-acetyltransferase [Thermoanaerobaculia bacterium]